MKNIVYIILSIIAFLSYACSDEDLPDESASFEPDDLSGKVVFQQVSVRTLKMADVNSMNNSTSYDYAMTYTRPVWSHDGSKFAAIELRSSIETGNEASDFVIKIVDVESGSTTIREIGSSVQLDLNGPLTWSSDGKTIAFLAHPYNRLIYHDTQNGDTIQTEFSEKISGAITALDWHPDGDIAVNISIWHEFQHDNEIWLLEPFTTTLKNKISASPFVASYNFEYIDWNKDGSKLLLSTSAYYNEIEVLDANTGEYSNVPNVHGLASCWSPDGKYIMYTGISGHNGLRLIPGLFVTDINGSFEKLLITDAGYSDWQ